MDMATAALATMFLQGSDGGSSGGGGRGRGGRGRGNGSGRGNSAHGANANARSSPTDETSSDNTTSTRVHDYSGPTIDSFAVNLHRIDGNASHVIPKHWIILDSASSIDLFVNPQLLTDIRVADNPITITSNAGEVTVDQHARLDGYPERVWYHPNRAANVLSLHNIAKHFTITYNSSEENAMRLYFDEQRHISFSPSSHNGLFYYDTSVHNPLQQHGDRTTFNFVTTVADKKAAYTQRGIKDAQLARKIQNIMMRPNTRKFMELVSRNFIRNCPITRRHIQAAKDIYGPNIGSLRGRTPRQNVGHIAAYIDPVPPEILITHGNVVLAIDIMFINKVAFLITISRGLHIGTITVLENRQVKYVQQFLEQGLKQYEKRGLTIESILADDEFTPLVYSMPTYTFNICGADEHVPDIERYISYVQPRTLYAHNTMICHMPTYPEPCLYGSLNTRFSGRTLSPMTTVLPRNTPPGISSTDDS